jgi:hypothetical protein
LIVGFLGAAWRSGGAGDNRWCVHQLRDARDDGEWSGQRLVESESLGDALARLFHNTPLKPLVDKLVLANGDRG